MSMIGNRLSARQWRSKKRREAMEKAQAYTREETKLAPIQSVIDKVRSDK